MIDLVQFGPHNFKIRLGVYGPTPLKDMVRT